MCLNTIASGIGGSQGTNFFNAQVDAQVLVRINGLPWINNSYNIKASGSNNTGNATIASFTFVNNSQQTQYFYSSNKATFGKNQDICSITIDYVRLSDLGTPAVTEGQTFPTMAFIFDIFGIDDYKINQVDQRIIK